jgi:hypothetical protein
MRGAGSKSHPPRPPVLLVAEKPRPVRRAVHLQIQPVAVVRASPHFGQKFWWRMLVKLQELPSVRKREVIVRQYFRGHCWRSVTIAVGHVFRRG